MTSAKVNQSVSASQSLFTPIVPFVREITIPAEIEETYPLSPIQQGMLFHFLYEPRSGIDIEQVVCTLQEVIDVQRLIKAWQQVIDRHPILRTCFGWDSQNEPVQKVRSSLTVQFNQRDWQTLTSVEQTEQLQALLNCDRQQGFDLRESLMRFTLIQTASEHYQLIWSFHHILLDGRSITKVLQEVFALYDDSFVELTESRPYRDYIEQLQQQDWSKSKAHWQQLLRGFTTPTPLLTVPTLHSIEKQSGHGTAEVALQFTRSLQAFTTQHNITPNTLIQAAWALLLHRYSNEETIVFGATRACRRSLLSDGDSIVGLMMNTLPVRVDIASETELLPWLQELRSQHLAIRPHENTPLSEVQAWSEVPRGTGLFESIVVFEHDSFGDRIQTSKNRSFELIEQPSFPLVLIGSLGTELTLKISYDRQRFEAATIDRMLGHLQVLLTEMIANPNQKLVEIPILTVTERHQLLLDWNATEANYQQHLCLHQLFEAQVERTPNAIAIVFQGQSMTYAEVNQQANQIAHHLRSIGIEAGQFVGVFVDRRLEMIPALLGILKAGGAYIPLETSFPKARIEWILDSLAVRCVLTQAAYTSTFDAVRSLEHLICLDSTVRSESSHQVWIQTDLQHCSIDNLPLHSTSEDTAYVIFTSGSTGTPKGVIVKHRPVINLIEWVNRTFKVNRCDRVLFITSLCFDLSVYDIFGLLAAGGSIQIASSEDVRDPQVLINLLQSEPITFWDSAPPALQQLSPLFSTLLDRPSSLRLTFMSGDWIPVTLPIALQQTFPGLQVVSLGGATEATVWSNYYCIDRVEPHWTSIPYGKPIQNAQYYVLDAQFNPCPIGVMGELYIAGECLAAGYTDPIKTEERFLPNPFSCHPNARLYRTGDLARFFEDGNIEFLGRIDHQVKIRGYRIELGEIEGVLSQHTAVRASIVLAREDQPGEKRLVAYVVKQAETDSCILRQHLREKLPEYMIPSAIVFLDAIPLTQNGKVDRRALPIPEAVRIDRSDVIELTQNPLERQLMFIWERVLEIQPIDVTDNFFDLGGNSLTAVKLINQVEKAFGQQLSIASLFQAPTIQQFAEILRDGRPVDPWAIIEITPMNGKKPPLFWCQNYGDMIPYLDPDQPFYALESGYQQVKHPETHIVELATGYVDRIRQIQPEGPYLIGGYCFGGYVALEIAQQLRSQNQEVALLALVETYGTDVPYYQRDRFTFRNALIELVGIRRRILSFFEYRRHALKDQRKAEETGGRVVKVVLPPKAPIQKAIQNYVPKPYFGRVVLFAAELSSHKSVLAPKAFWGKVFQGEFTIASVKGNHQTVVFYENGRELVKRIHAVIDRVISV